ncbi:MAG: hypothetical protein HYY37_02355 [Candidatus Aenigmarchaeota archaeon]|nr:hypothetical protein [Candidatus Aenigmarchaeota archaeon]
MEDYWADIIVSLAVVLIVVGFFIWSGTIGPSLDEQLRGQAALNAQQIAGIINVLQASPSGTTHAYHLPARECKVKIGIQVNFSIDEGVSHVTDYIRTPAALEQYEFDCDEQREKTLTFSRADGRITIQG